MSINKAATQTKEELFDILSELLKDLFTSPDDTKTDYQGYYQRFHALGLRQELEEVAYPTIHPIAVKKLTIKQLNETLPKHSSSLLEVAEKVNEHKNGLIDCYHEQKRLEKLHETATKRKAIVEQMLQIMKEEEHPLFLAMEVLDRKRLMNEEQDPIFWAMKEKNDALAEQKKKEDAEMVCFLGRVEALDVADEVVVLGRSQEASFVARATCGEAEAF